MIIVFYILLAICELAFAAIILTEVYWAVVFLADRVVKPLWYKLNDFILSVYVMMITEEWLLREEVKGGADLDGPSGESIESAGSGPGSGDDPAPRD